MDDYAGFEPQLGEIRALRTFRIGPDARLYPLYSDTPWVDGVNTARCNVPVMPDEARFDAQPHHPPAPDCSCGYYAYATVAGTADQPHAQHVLAVVAGWGKVIAGTRGIRAEHARVEALWLSPAVPADLAARVAERYPATAIFADREAMVAAHPPDALDCYEPETPARRSGHRRATRFAILAALVLGCLPAAWIWGHPEVRATWAIALGVFIAATVLLRRAHHDLRSRATAMLYSAVAIWLIAPFAGPAGIFLLRLPLLQIVVLGQIQRRRLNREAVRFPARIARLGH